jgi:hypothetical protein
MEPPYPNRSLLEPVCKINFGSAYRVDLFNFIIINIFLYIFIIGLWLICAKQRLFLGFGQQISCSIAVEKHTRIKYS